MLQHSHSLKAVPRRLLTRQDVINCLQVSPRTLSRMISDGRLPRPIKVGRNNRWPEEEIEAWIDSRPRWGE